LAAEELLGSKSSEMSQIRKLLESSLLKMAHKLEENLLFYNMNYMIAGIAVIFAV
jgi:hypothetical protein